MYLIVFFAANAFAQDVIVKKDGSTIMSKVLEIGTNEIKYKKFSNQEGPTYTVLSSDVLAINYENGEKETFQVTNEDATVEPNTISEGDNPDTKVIKLNVGTEIPVQNINYVQAADLYVGQNVNFRVSRDVKSDNVVLIPYGTTVKGTVYEAKKSGGFGKKGRLGIRVDEVALPDGKTVPVNEGNVYVMGKNRTALSVCLFLLVTWPACFITGSKAELPAGYELITKVASPVVFTYKNNELVSEILEAKKQKTDTVSDYLYDATIIFENGYICKARIISEDEKYVSYRLQSKPNGKVYQKKKKYLAIKKL